MKGQGASAGARGGALGSLRVEVVRALTEGSCTARELAQRLGKALPSVRRQLQELRSLGLVVRRGSRYSLLWDGGLKEELQPWVPPPWQCLQCGQSSYIAGLLKELVHLLHRSRDQNERLRRLSAQILRAQEEERKRVARELHDDTAQALAALLVRLGLLEKQVDATLIPQVAELRQLVADALEGVRRLALGLRPSALDHLGLAPALLALCDEFSRHWGFAVHMDVEPLPRLHPDTELALYRVGQEALTNVAKHARASQVWVSLHRVDDAIVLEVRDDGCGFRMAAVKSQREKGLGLFGMEERLSLVGGHLEIRSRPRRGTTVRARIPIRG